MKRRVYRTGLRNVMFASAFDVRQSFSRKEAEAILETALDLSEDERARLVEGLVAGSISGVLVHRAPRPLTEVPPIDIEDLVSEPLVELAWIEIEVCGPEGTRFPDAIVEVAPPSEASRRVALDDTGMWRIDSLPESGACTVRLLEPGAAVRGYTEAPTRDRVDIAAGGNPIRITTGRKYFLYIAPDVLRLRVRGLAPYFELVGPMPFRLEVGAAVLEGSIDTEDQELVLQIDARQTRGTLTLDEKDRIAFEIGPMAAAHERSGAHSRLVNLGFGNAAEGDTEDFQDALAAFQRCTGISPTCELDETTAQELDAHYSKDKNHHTAGGPR